MRFIKKLRLLFNKKIKPAKKLKLEIQLLNEIRALAKVNGFPHEDSETIAGLLSAYDEGSPFLDFKIMEALDTLDKYPELAANWDALMLKYKIRGLFPNWDIIII